MRLACGLVSLLVGYLAYAAGVVAIYPSPNSTTPNATTQYIIYNSTSGTGITWSVNGVVGGNSSVGTITTAGLYTAPAAVPMSNVVTVTATSVPSGIYG